MKSARSEQPKTEKCNICGTLMTDDEWVVGWGWCHECWDRSLAEYDAEVAARGKGEDKDEPVEF